MTRLTTDEANDTDAKWSADGKWVYFLSTRTGSSQVWRIRPTGGEAEQVTKLELGPALGAHLRSIVEALGPQ